MKPQLLKWLNVTITYDGSSDASGINIYVNGGNPRNTDDTNTPLTNTIQVPNDFLIGCYGSCPGNAFNGKVDEVMIFNRELTQNEVNQIFLMTM